MTPNPKPSHPDSNISPSEPHHVTLVDQLPDPVATHQSVYPPMSSEPSKVHKRRWNIVAILRDVIRQNKRGKPLEHTPNIRESVIAICKTSWLNVLLVFIPLSWIFHFLHLNNTLIFVFSFLAIVPLAKLLAFATDELSMRVGQTLAGLLNATLGNAVELIVAIIALIKCELTVVQSSLVGSILSNLLLVLGMCFFAGGTRFSEQGFGISAVQLNSSLLTLSVIAVLLPAAFHNAVQPSNFNGIDPLTDAQEGHDILSISHGVAVILLFIYLCYLVFQLVSHKNLYEDNHSSIPETVQYNDVMAKRLHIQNRNVHPASGSPRPSNDAMGHQTMELEAGPKEGDGVDEEKPEMNITTTVALLAVVTVLVAVTAEFLVVSIDGLTSSGHISKGFVGLILLPIVGNAAEHVTAVTVSVKNKLTLSIGVAVGSSIQIALFVIPFTVVLGWILGKPLTLLFDSFESIVLFLAVLTVNYVVQDGKSNWLEGMILMCLYVIVALTFWYYPVSDPAGILASCT